VTGESEGVTGGSEIVVTEIRGLSESAVTMSELPVTMSERVVDVWQRRLTKQLPEPSQPELPLPIHGNVRGSTYYH
jgi:hypothetical protein